VPGAVFYLAALLSIYPFFVVLFTLMASNTPELTQVNAEKSIAVASVLFPFEEWIPHGKGIFVAKSRLSGGHKEQAKLYREIADVRILTGRGSVAYFLPERSNDRDIVKDKELYSMHADTVIDGIIVEIKTVSGNRATLGKSFRRGYKQGRSLLVKHGISAEHSVFLRIFTPFSVDSVRAKIAGELKNTADKGFCICYFEAIEELYFWPYDELRAIVGK
jgi:hypothetical protein